jgi:F1F0 ATPase subunit 2
MTDWITLTLALVAGLLLGAMFFGGLWWTVRRAVSSRNPALWFSGSTVVRTALALAGFYEVGNHHWQRLLMCLFGFVAARLILIWLTGPVGSTPKRSTQGASHAP